MHNGTFILKEGNVRLSDRVKVREECFGAIVYHQDTGDIVEIDHEAYKLLVWLRKAGVADIQSFSRRKDVRTVLSVLLDLAIIEYVRADSRYDCLFTLNGEASIYDVPRERDCLEKTLSAPETVHLAVTYRCEESCPDCYAQEYRSYTDDELGTTEMCGIIDTLADHGIFQLAIGGGEPFLRSDLCDIVSHAANRGLAVHITTGQYVLKHQWAAVLKHIKSLHIGIRSEELINDVANASEKLIALTKWANKAGIRLGANIIMTRFTIRNIDKLTEILLESGVKRLIFLRYKPIANQIRWHDEKPGREEIDFFYRWLIQTKYQHSSLEIRVDCASAFLMRDIVRLAAIRSGIKGCTAGVRIISVSPDGSVYPCSQLVRSVYHAGNLMCDSFEKIWQESDVLNKLRHFRQSATFMGSVCGKCSANRFCGGCRVFAEDIVGGEVFCPMGVQEEMSL